MFTFLLAAGTVGFTALGGYNAGRFAQTRVHAFRRKVQAAEALAGRVDEALATASQGYQYAKAAYNKLNDGEGSDRAKALLAELQALVAAKDKPE